MIVWCVFEGWPYEGLTLRGVYSSQAKADEHAAQIEAHGRSGRPFGCVKGWNVDGEPVTLEEPNNVGD